MAAKAFKESFDQAEPVTIWPAPDMSVLNSGRRNPPDLPQDMFGPMWAMLEDFANGAGCAVDYVAVGLLPVLASLIGAKRKVRPYESADWSEPCILWCGLVGDPSSNKSPALDRVTNPLRKLEADAAIDHHQRHLGWMMDAERAKVEKSAWQEEVKGAQKDGAATPPLPETAIEPLEPQRRRFMVQDSTPEQLASILAGNQSGTLHLRDELVGWMNGFERYNAGGREFWLEAYGGRPFRIDRKSSPEPIFLPFNGVSVVGGIQPERLADALLGRNSPDDGLVARFLWCWPNRPPYSRPSRCGDTDALTTVFQRLEALPWGMGLNGEKAPITLPLDDTAADLFEQFERENRNAGDEAAGLYKSFVGKLPGTVLRLSLVVEMLRWAYGGGEEPRSISVGTVGAVVDFVDDYAKPSAQRVFGDAALPLVERNAATLARLILKNDMRWVNARELKRSPFKQHLPGMREAEPLNDALKYLVDADWLRSMGTRAGGTVGRASTDYAVNPGLFGGSNG